MGPLARIVLATGSALAVCICTATPALAAGQHHHHHSGQQQQDDQPDNSTDPSTDPAPQGQFSDPGGDLPFPVPAAPQATSGPAQTVQIQLTGYGAPDNTPAGSKTISMPVIHQEAGGTCTYADPTTFASPGSAGSTEFPKGERVYIGKIRCYGISEDSGATAESVKHIDFYTGDGPGSVTGPCEDEITGPTSIIVNPPPGEPAIAGPLSTASGCRVNQTTGTNTGARGATHAHSGHAPSTPPASADDN